MVIRKTVRVNCCFLLRGSLIGVCLVKSSEIDGIPHIFLFGGLGGGGIYD